MAASTASRCSYQLGRCSSWSKLKAASVMLVDLWVENTVNVLHQCLLHQPGFTLCNKPRQPGLRDTKRTDPTRVVPAPPTPLICWNIPVVFVYHNQLVAMARPALQANPALVPPPPLLIGSDVGADHVDPLTPASRTHITHRSATSKLCFFSRPAGTAKQSPRALAWCTSGDDTRHTSAFAQSTRSPRG